VAIYFDIETKKQIFSRIADTMVPGATLLIGSSEMLFNISDRFERKEYDGIIFYQLIG